MKIKVLSDSVINQIAAGEVVDRPSGVVRELVDNAIDAGATDIFVTLQGGGNSRLKVRDNGYGMAKDDAILAFERHATSKVSAIDDLTGIVTMGFRGEALASIAAVSKVQLRTKEQNSDIGTHVVFRGGRLVNVEPVPWSQGTEIEVEHLFFNTPARRKFLKSPKSELARTRTWLAHSSLSHPEVRYRLVSDGDEILHLRPVSSMVERAKDVFSSELLSCDLTEGGVRVQAMVSHPGEALSDASGLVILVNGRLVTDRVILRAVREGYDSMLKDREFPTGYVALEVSGEFVDVNVHPQKSEVRFRHPNQIFAVVRGAILSGVRGLQRPVQVGRPSIAPLMTESIPTAKQEPSSSRVGTEIFSEVSQSRTISTSPAPLFSSESYVRTHVDTYEAFSPKDTDLAAASSDDFAARPSFRFSDLRYVGQILGCYLLCEWQDSFVIVDMHAAHERVNYTHIRDAYSRKELTPQPLLIPQRVTLSYEQVNNLTEQIELIRALGFDVTEVDPQQIEIRAVPSVLSHVNCSAVIRDLAAEPVVAGWQERVEERIDHIAARVACHASVRSGDAINRQEAYALFDQLDSVFMSGACPHGRPVVAQFSRDAVEKWFGRDR
jgi:DNA mismatch repair protein MutL